MRRSGHGRPERSIRFGVHGARRAEHDAYRRDDVPRFGYAFTTPGLFVRDDIDVRPWLALSMSGRLDRHSAYGWFISPRVSVLLRSGGWSTRLSAGTGFFGPTALTEEAEAAGLTRLTVDGPLRAERGRSFSMDLTRTHGPAAWTVTVFGSRIADPVHVDRAAYVMRNLDHPTKNLGAELLGTFRRPPFALTASYTYVRAREHVAGVTADVAQTPRHGLGLVAMAENEDGRIGFELYYTGRQRLERTFGTAPEAQVPGRDDWAVRSDRLKAVAGRTADDFEEFDTMMRAQRVIDARLWE